VELHGRHGAAIGSTGSGKSTALASLIDGKRPTLVIACDRSDPLLAAVQHVQGVVWTPCGTLGWDVLAGDLEDAVERLTAAWQVVSPGEVFRGIARVYTRQELAAMGGHRSVRGLIDRLGRLDVGGVEREALRGWLARFRDLADSLGPALGQDLDLAAALRERKTVLLQLNAFRSPILVRLFATLALLDAARCAEAVGTFTVLVDEGGYLKDPDALEALFRSGRARGVSVVLATQDPTDLGRILKQNVEVWWLGRQGPDASAWASKLTRLAPESFSMRALDKLEGWLYADDRLQRVRLRPPRRPDGSTGVTHRGSGGVPAEPVTVASIAPDKPAWLGEDEQLDNIWRHHTFPDGADGCWLSTYSRQSSGRPRCSYNGQEWITYDLLLALHDGKPLHEVRMRLKAKTLTVDHRCPNIACDNPAHLSWKSRSRNSALRWARHDERPMRRTAVQRGGRTVTA
jgi:hypothetical protein